MAIYSIVQKPVGMQMKNVFALSNGRDRAQLFIDGKWVTTQYQTEIGEDIFVQGKKKTLSRIDILIENMGRVNYGHKFLQTPVRIPLR